MPRYDFYFFQSTVSVFLVQSRPGATNNTILQSQTTSAQSQYSLSTALATSVLQSQTTLVQSQYSLSTASVTLVLQSALQILITLFRSLKMGNYNINNTPLVNLCKALAYLFNTFYTNIAQAIRNNPKYLKNLNMVGTFQQLFIYIAFLTNIKSGL